MASEQAEAPNKHSVHHVPGCFCWRTVGFSDFFFWRICSRGIILLWILKSFFHIFHIFHLSTRWLWANVATSWWHLLHLDCHHLGMDGTASKVLQRAKPWCHLCEKRDWDKLCGRRGQIWEKHGKTMELTRPREYNKQDCANRDIGHPPTHTHRILLGFGVTFTLTHGFGLRL